MHDRRKFIRVKFFTDVDVVFNGHIYGAKLLDLSLKGALMQPSARLPINTGDLCYFRIALSDTHLKLDFNAELAHKENKHLGFKFLSLDLDTLTHLRRLLELNISDSTRITNELWELMTA